MQNASNQVHELIEKLETEHGNALVDLNLLIFSINDLISYLKRFNCEHMPGGVPGAIRMAEERVKRTRERFNLENQ